LKHKLNFLESVA